MKSSKSTLLPLLAILLKMMERSLFRRKVPDSMFRKRTKSSISMYPFLSQSMRALVSPSRYRSSRLQRPAIFSSQWVRACWKLAVRVLMLQRWSLTEKKGLFSSYSTPKQFLISCSERERPTPCNSRLRTAHLRSSGSPENQILLLRRTSSSPACSPSAFTRLLIEWLTSTLSWSLRFRYQIPESVRFSSSILLMYSLTLLLEVTSETDRSVTVSSSRVCSMAVRRILKAGWDGFISGRVTSLQMGFILSRQAWQRRLSLLRSAPSLTGVSGAGDWSQGLKLMLSSFLFCSICLIFKSSFSISLEMSSLLRFSLLGLMQEDLIALADLSALVSRQGLVYLVELILYFSFSLSISPRFSSIPRCTSLELVTSVTLLIAISLLSKTSPKRGGSYFPSYFPSI